MFSFGPHPLAKDPDDGGHDRDGGGGEGRGGEAGHVLHDGNPQDVHSHPVQAVGEDEDVGGRVGGLTEVKDHIDTLVEKDLTARLFTIRTGEFNKCE